MAPHPHRKTKLDPYLDQLGILPDAELAAMAGVTAENVRAYRTRRGIAARWRGERGSEGAAAAMGATPAKAPEKPPKRRKAAKPKHIDRTTAEDLAVTDSIPEADAVEGIGTPVDVEDGLGEEGGSNVEPADRGTPAGATLKGARARRTRLASFLDKLGVIPDAELAALARVTAENVRTYRKRRGVPALWRGEALQDAFVRGTDGRRGKLSAYKEQIGILSDARIAELAGTSPANVRAWRLRHDIPARWRGEGSPLPNEEAIRLLDEGRAPAEPRRRTSARTAPAREAARPAPAPVVGRLDGYEVTVEPDETWLVVAPDIAEAARKAMASLAERGIQGRVLNLRFVARLLEG